MSSVFERNLRLLEKYQPRIHRKLVSYLNGQYKPLNSQVNKIFLANQGEMIINMLVVSGGIEYLLCDHEDPVNQAYRWIDKYIDPSVKSDIVFGMGFGYHIEVLLASFKNRKVIVIEPNMELFHQILRVRNLETIIEKTEIFLDEPVDSILRRVNALLWDASEGGIQCEPFEVYGELFWNLWDELRYKFIKHAESFNVDIATKRLFGELWVHNNIANLNKITQASNFSGLTGKFTGVPGILVSAGPSLQKNVHLLNGIKDKCVLMAAGTAVNVLEDYGVEPHFMVGIDASEGEAAIHRKVKSKGIYFIYSNQVATGSINGYEGPKFLMNYSADTYTGSFFKNAEIPSETFLSGPSVANTCFDLLYKMGCNPIILVGQDLAYTDNKTHAGENPGPVMKSREELLKQGYRIELDQEGNEVLTRNSFIAMKNWFEGYFEKLKAKVEIINATEGGLNIEHAENAKLQEVIEKYITRAVPVHDTISRKYEEHRFEAGAADKLAEYKASVLSEVNKLEGYSKDQARIIELIKRDIYHPDKDRKAFDKAAERLNKFMDLVMDSSIYKSLLKNVIEIDFYIIKAEVDRSMQEARSYREAKPIYVNAMEQQNEMLKSKLEKLKALLG